MLGVAPGERCLDWARRCRDRGASVRWLDRARGARVAVVGPVDGQGLRQRQLVGESVLRVLAGEITIGPPWR